VREVFLRWPWQVPPGANAAGRKGILEQALPPRSSPVLPSGWPAPYSFPANPERHAGKKACWRPGLHKTPSEAEPGAGHDRRKIVELAEDDMDLVGGVRLGWDQEMKKADTGNEEDQYGDFYLTAS